MDRQTPAETRAAPKGVKLLTIAALLLLLVVGVVAAHRLLNRHTMDTKEVNQKKGTSAPRDTREEKVSTGYGSDGVVSDDKGAPRSDTTATKKPEVADGKPAVSSTLPPNRKPGTQSRVADPVSPKGSAPTPHAEGTSSVPNSPKSQPSHGQSSQSPSSSSGPPTPAPQPSVDQANQLRRTMEARYGVKILYGTETGHYRPGGRITTPLVGDAIKEALQELDRVLGRYPAGFFREFSAYGVNLSFYLVAGIAQGSSFAGFADAQFMNDLKITLLKLPLMSFTAHHEIMHAIDSFMELKMYPGNPYDEYTALNPAGFQYGVFNKALVWGHSENSAYFTTEYGQTNRREDKAEMFKFMTRESGSVGAIFARHPHLNAKARVIARQIDAVFQTAGPNEFWTRHLR